MHEDCSFVGTYKRLKKHVKSKHRSSKPCEVDSARLAEWEEFENEKERQDAISIVSALNPGSVIMGDYIIDPDSDIGDSYSDNSLDDISDSTSSDNDDEGSYGRDSVHRDGTHRRNGDMPSRNLTYVGGSSIRQSASTSSQRPLRVGFVLRSLSQPRNN